MKPSELAAWIRQARAQGADRFVLAQLIWKAEGEGTAPVRTYLAQEGDPAEMAEDAFQSARDDAGDTGGAQKYALFATREGEPIGRKVWRVSGVRFSDEGTLTEPPNAVGVTAMLMRHLEADKRIAVQKEAATFGVLERVIERLEGENNAMRARELDVLKLIEELSTNAHTRALELTKEVNRAELKHRAFTKLEPLVSMMGAKLLGVPMAPGSEASSALDSFLSSITEEQAAAMAQHLTQAQFISLQQLYKEGAEREAKREAAKKKHESEINGKAAAS